MAQKPSYYITTAIHYPNGAPHIGHAYENIATDAMARFQALDGKEVFFLTGTDEHGLKMAQTAEKKNLTPAELAEKNSSQFRDLAEALGCANTDFIRTSEPRHHKSAQDLWRRMAKNGDIYADHYSGWYSVRDEAFYDEDETELGEDGARYGPQGTMVEWTEEETFFFKLSAYEDKLLAYYESHPDFIGPQERRNEVVSFVKGGLRDLSVSRTTFDWGIPVPDAPGHIMYVWVDALANYLTGVGFPDKENDTFKTFWPADVHVIGKDIVRFHAVYWPAFLMSAGLPLPKRIFAHGFIFNKGEKMSKSLGNVIDPFKLVQHYGVDQLRYFFLREIPFGKDGTYSHEGIVNRTNADLANDLGNLAQRSLSMIAKNCGNALPESGALSDADRAMLALADAAYEKVCGAMQRQAIHRAIEAIWQVIAEANRYFTKEEPWVLRKTDPARMNTVLYVTAEVVRQTTMLAQPIMPTSCTKLLEALNVPENQRKFDALGAAGRMVPGRKIAKPTPVFPKYTEEDA